MLSGEMPCDHLGNIAKDVELLTREQVGEAVPHRCEVHRRRCRDRCEPGVGEDNVEPTCVAVARSTPDGPSCLHSGDLV